MLSQIKSDLISKLKDKSYRHRFFRARAEDEIASQLQEFRKNRALTQGELARLCGMKQTAIAGIERSTRASGNFTALWRIARALDLRVRIVIDDMQTVVNEYELRDAEYPVALFADPKE
jgi:transcriptional regulator with XRE-family HTH domain